MKKLKSGKYKKTYAHANTNKLRYLYSSLTRRWSELRKNTVIVEFNHSSLTIYNYYRTPNHSRHYYDSISALPAPTAKKYHTRQKHRAPSAHKKPGAPCEITSPPCGVLLVRISQNDSSLVRDSGRAGKIELRAGSAYVPALDARNVAKMTRGILHAGLISAFS